MALKLENESGSVVIILCERSRCLRLRKENEEGSEAMLLKERSMISMLSTPSKD